MDRKAQQAEARRIVDGRFDELMTEFKKTFMANWFATKPGEVEGREELYRQMHALETFANGLKALARD